MSSCITDLRTLSDACLVSGILDSYLPIALLLDLGELILVDSWVQKVKSNCSGYQINEGTEHL